MQKKTALNMIFANRKGILVNFENEQKLGEFLAHLEKMHFVKEKTVLDPLLNLQSKKATEQWKNEAISTFKYLMLVNLYSSRSYQDFSQYPVFPLINYGFSKQQSIRDLS